MSLLLIDSDLTSDSFGASGPRYKRVARKCCKQDFPDIPLLFLVIGLIGRLLNAYRKL